MYAAQGYQLLIPFSVLGGGAVAEQNPIHPGNTTITRQGIGNVTITRRDIGNTTITRTGIGSATVSAKGS